MYNVVVIHFRGADKLPENRIELIMYNYLLGTDKTVGSYLLLLDL